MTAIATNTVLKEIRLIYSDGTIISVPEKKVPTVGAVFMQAIQNQNLEWDIISTGKLSLQEKVKKAIDKFFSF